MKKILKITSIVLAAAVVLAAGTFAALRLSHKLLHIGDYYVWSSATRFENGLHDKHPINNDNIGEIKYMKNIDYFDYFGNELTDAEFLADMPKLKMFFFGGDEPLPYDRRVKLPSLKNSTDLMFVTLKSLDVDDLDFLAENYNLYSVTLRTHSHRTVDISALRDKEKLYSLWMINCEPTDYSMLLDMDRLTTLRFDMVTVPEDVREALLAKGMKFHDDSGDHKPEK